jgi:general secretion pathway protein K
MSKRFSTNQPRMAAASPRSTQRGAVLIIVLWTAALLTVLVTAMAAKVRLSAQTVVNNHDSATRWMLIMDAMNKAKAELMLEAMPPSIELEQERDPDGEVRNPKFRFNGQPIQLYYPGAEDMTVRIYSHAGKISLNRPNRTVLRMLIEERLGGIEVASPAQVQALSDAWTDWTDLNSLASGPGGGESDYYRTLDPPYEARNNPDLETVEEILLIRGFAELFDGVDVDAAFTVYGNHRQLNLNYATREAMRLLPAMTEEVIESVIAFREQRDINSREDMAQFIPFEILQEISNWIGNSDSQFYSIYVYPTAQESEQTLEQLQSEDEFVNPDPVTRAYMEIVETSGWDTLPRVLKVDPYARLPDTAPARVSIENSMPVE